MENRGRMMSIIDVGDALRDFPRLESQKLIAQLIHPRNRRGASKVECEGFFA